METAVRSLTRYSWVLSLALIAAAATALVLLVADGQGREPEPTEPAVVGATLEGVPQHGDTLGSETAPHVLVLYLSPECTDCAQLYWGVLPELIESRVRTGALRIIVRPVAVPGSSPEGVRETYAAGRQDRMFRYVLTYDLLALRGDGPMAVARAVRGIDTARLRRDRDSVDVANEVREAEARAEHLDASPPAMFFDPAGHGSSDVRRLDLAQPAPVIVAQVEALTR